MPWASSGQMLLRGHVASPPASIHASTHASAHASAHASTSDPNQYHERDSYSKHYSDQHSHFNTRNHHVDHYPHLSTRYSVAS
mmetsp:Transcript_82218/g.233087  ORF Transcript_82218/g.233087 Transcript_82218/m.233087 type:complete len:83 (-) Transcript_82218:880-1128(-)